MRRLYQQVADQIRDLIAAGQLAPSARLPGERELAQQLNVSRPSLREALIALEIDGTVEIRQGSGIYVVGAADRASKSTRSLGESPTELMQARLAVEGSVILLACARVDAEFLAQLRATSAAMRGSIAGGINPMPQDRAFHARIAEQTGNTVLVRIIASLFDERFSRISAQISSRYENNASWTAALHEHEIIMRALEDRDSLSAQAAMTRHLQMSTERWIET